MTRTDIDFRRKQILPPMFGRYFRLGLGEPRYPLAGHDRTKALASAFALLVIFALVLTPCGPVFGEKNDAVEAFNLGKEHLEKGEYDKAIQLFSKALTLLDPSDRNARVVTLARARGHYKKGDLDSALKDVSRVLGSAGLEGENRASGLQLRGIIHNSKGSDQQALQDFTESIKTAHSDMVLRASSFANRGMVFIGMGRNDEAVSDFNKAIELNPHSAFAFAGRGFAYLRKDNVETARRDTNKALALNPDEQTTKIAEQVLRALSVSFTGADRVTVPLGEDGHIFVQVRFGRNGRAHRFLLDTGATFTLISKELLESARKETEVKLIGAGRVMTADGATHAVMRYKIKDAFLFNFPLGEIEVHVFATQRRMSAHLLGAGSLKQIAISIDNASRKAELRRTDPSQDQAR